MHNNLLRDLQLNCHLPLLLLATTRVLLPLFFRLEELIVLRTVIFSLLFPVTVKMVFLLWVVNCVLFVEVEFLTDRSQWHSRAA